MVSVMILRLNGNTDLIYKSVIIFMKTNYSKPNTEFAEMMSTNLICASGINGTNEDFGKGEPFSFDLLETSKPF